MNVLGYTEGGQIRIGLDGTEVLVPDDTSNRHRRMIAEWEAEGNTIPAYAPPPPSADNVIAERERRLGLGFDYDFGDERGVHRIGTSAADMVGWDEVTKYANAMVALGDTASTITIVTDTGPTAVTALEWQSVLVAAGAFRQPIWQASFILQVMDPIPADYADDNYWP